MKRGRFSEEQIVGILKEHEAGRKIAELSREHGISEATLYGWKSKYGGMEVGEAQRLRSLEDENRRLSNWWPISAWTKKRSRRSYEKTGGACRLESGCGVCGGAVCHERTPGLQARGVRPQQLSL